MNSSLFWCIAGILGGAIISFLISYFFYFKGLRKEKITYDIKTFCIISDKTQQIEGLEVKYNSTEINNLFSSTITIKNIGNSVIEKDDFAPSCPLTISTDGKFLVDKTNGVHLTHLNKTNNIHPIFKIDNNGLVDRIIITFDYISKKEEITCSLFHTGNISFDGVLKDGKIMSRAESMKHKTIIMNILEFFVPILSSDFY